MKILKSPILTFWFLLALVEILGLFSFFYWGKLNCFFFLNGGKSLVLDFLFFLVTSLGEWPFILFALFIVFRKHPHFLVHIALVFILNGVFSFVLKHWVFGPIPRPPMLLQHNPELFVNSMLKVSYWNSFPSGHTFTAFAGFSMLAFIFQSTKKSVLFFFLALLAGYSRIYNGMHFLEDVLFGALLGTSLSYIIYRFVAPISLIKQ
jgi:membrane-associated phospholipid phosphatase